MHAHAAVVEDRVFLGIVNHSSTIIRQNLYTSSPLAADSSLHIVLHRATGMQRSVCLILLRDVCVVRIFGLGAREQRTRVRRERTGGSHAAAESHIIIIYYYVYIRTTTRRGGGPVGLHFFFAYNGRRCHTDIIIFLLINDDPVTRTRPIDTTFFPYTRPPRRAYPCRLVIDRMFWRTVRFARGTRVWADEKMFSSRCRRLTRTGLISTHRVPHTWTYYDMRAHFEYYFFFFFFFFPVIIQTFWNVHYNI